MNKLMFTPYAWAKLLMLRDFGNSEVGGFAITHPKDALLVEDFVTVKQTCNPAFVSFNDDSVSEFIEDQFEQGIQPAQCMRIWIHTHPGDSPNPSMTDEDTFRKCFGDCDYAIMFIIARGGKTYCRIKFKNPSVSQEIPVGINWYADCPAINQSLFEEEYKKNVRLEKPVIIQSTQVGWSPSKKTPEKKESLDDYDNQMLIEEGFTQEEIDVFVESGMDYAEIMNTQVPSYLENYWK